MRAKSEDHLDEELDDVDSADRIIVTDKGTFVCISSLSHAFILNVKTSVHTLCDM